jgi:hypothetical protein
MRKVDEADTRTCGRGVGERRHHRVEQRQSQRGAAAAQNGAAGQVFATDKLGHRGSRASMRIRLIIKAKVPLCNNCINPFAVSV